MIGVWTLGFYGPGAALKKCFEGALRYRGARPSFFSSPPRRRALLFRCFGASLGIYLSFPRCSLGRVIIWTFCFLPEVFEGPVFGFTFWPFFFYWKKEISPAFSYNFCLTHPLSSNWFPTRDFLTPFSGVTGLSFKIKGPRV